MLSPYAQTQPGGVQGQVSGLSPRRATSVTT